MNTKQNLIIVCLLIVSGVLSGTLNIILSLGGSVSSFSPALYLPGVIFGIIVGAWFFIVEKSKIIKVVIWSAASVVAYYLAVETFKILVIPSLSREFGVDNFLGYIAAGLVGSALLALATSFLIERLSLKKILFVILLGGIFGFVFGSITNERGYLAYVIWQVPIGFTLATMVNKNKKASVANY